MTRLTYGQRKVLPKSSFAIPKNKTALNPAGRGAYPIPDASHARNALARVSQFGTPLEKSVVRAKVHGRFPGMGKRKNPNEGVWTPSAMKILRAMEAPVGSKE